MNKRLQYLVTRHDGCWKVLTDKYYGPYADKLAAISNAVEAAHRSGTAGRDAEVILSDEGRMNVVWTYGDPFPYTKEKQAEPA
jgi:hypothetical protein